MPQEDLVRIKIWNRNCFVNPWNIREKKSPSVLSWIHPNDSRERKKICSRSACVTHQRLVLNSICHLFRRWTRHFWAASNIHSNWYVCVSCPSVLHTLKLKLIESSIESSILFLITALVTAWYVIIHFRVVLIREQERVERRRVGRRNGLLCPRLIHYSAFSDTTCHYRLSNQIYRAANAGLLSRLA